MYKGHVVFLGRGAVTSNRFWNGFVTDLLARDTGIPRNSAKEKLRGTSFQEIDFIFSVNSSLKILQKKLLRRPNRDVDASKTSPATCFFFFLKFHVNINTSPPKLTIANMSIKTHKTHIQIGFFCFVFSVALFSKSWRERKVNLPISATNCRKRGVPQSLKWY